MLGLAMLGAGCAQQKTPAREVDKQALAADSLYMARLYAGWEKQLEAQGKSRGGRGSHMEIDLADDTQYRFVKNRLLAAGSTPENSPQLFRKLETLRKEKKTGTPGPKAREDRLGATGEPMENSRCGHLLPLTDVASADNTVAKFQASGLVTCFDGADYAFADVNAIATNHEQTQFRVLGTESLEEYASAVLETPPLPLSLKVNPDEELFVDSVAMAFDEETGEQHLSYTRAESSLVALGAHDFNTITVHHPKELIGKMHSDNPVRTCLERGAVAGFLDCDYASGSKDPVTGIFKPFAKPFTGVGAADPEASHTLWIPAAGAYWEPASGAYDPSHLYLPMRGWYQVTLPSSCTLDAFTSDATIFLMERGGRCSAGTMPGSSVFKGSLPFKTPIVDDYDPTKLNVPFDGLVDFGKDCLDMYQNVRLLMRATMKATCVDSSGNRKPYTRSRTQDIFNLDWRNACLAEGTRVTKADGSQVPVEQVKVGDQLLANGQGQALTVTTVSRGGERKPLVKLRDALGGEVMVTQTHPMVTATRGVVQAGELKAGDSLLTRAGAAKLVGVERVPFSGDVFNFALGTPEELAIATPGTNTMYANGYLVGDSQMQLTLEKQRSSDSREVLARLNGAWHEDFRLHQARSKSARR
ncbi:hypothetical protein Q664_44890 [Archangium violaceum Cb vi76]|uniref:Hint domain-containing protein n=2 Tax=Archangium violaceum TaxID=83451 RepID=A0A084SHI6_9BACT|nr:hypothetical protein Q664_44890 [Archangium violaceum Cb vi76]